MGDPALPALPEGVVELKEDQYAFGAGKLLIQMVRIVSTTFRIEGVAWVQIVGIKWRRGCDGRLISLGELSVAVKADTLVALMRR